MLQALVAGALVSLCIAQSPTPAPTIGAISGK